MKKAAVITTGNEVFYGRIKDGFTPVIEKKINEFGVEWYSMRLLMMMIKR